MPHSHLTARPPSGGRCRRHGGFTIVELVVVMLLMAILGSVAMGRFADREPFAVQAAADQLVSGLRLAQATAIAQRQEVHVVLSANPAQLQLCLDSACTLPLQPPGGQGSWLDNAQDLQLSSAAAFRFGASGAPSITSVLQLQVRSGTVASRSVQVEPVTGHVHQP